MEETQTQEPAVEQAPAQEAVAEQPVQEQPVQESIQEAPLEVPAEPSKPPFEIFDSPQDLIASMQRDAAQAEPEPEAVQPEPRMAQPVSDPVQGQEQMQYTQADVEGAVLGFLSERLGRQVGSLDELAQPQQLDERVETIARFVQETGRRPEDWFTYQRLNTSEMDNITAIRVQMSADNPSLSGEEVNLLVKSKYGVSKDASEEQKRLAQLQMKIDGEKAKSSIEQIRQGYSAPEPAEQQAAEPIITEQWINEMAVNVDALTGLEFDLGGEKTFTFGLDDTYKGQLKQKNAQLENYFDPYIRPDGSWDYDLLSSHRAVVDNIDKIVQSAYRQGMSDGHRGVVQNAANVQTKAPNDASGQQNSNPLGEQVKQILQRNRSTMTFNI